MAVTPASAAPVGRKVPTVGVGVSSGTANLSTLVGAKAPAVGVNAPANTTTVKGGTPVPAASGSAQSGFSQLTSKLAAYVAPTTFDTVHFGQYGAAGNYVYIGPDGQPYEGSKSDFNVTTSGGKTLVNPIIGKAKAVTFAALGINAPTVVTESQYKGPGADSAQANDANYDKLLAADAGSGGASLVVSSKSVANQKAGTYTEQNGVAALTGALPPSLGVTSPLAPIIAKDPAASVVSATGGSNAVDPTTGTSATSNPQTTAQQLIDDGTGGGSGVAGSGSIASDVPVATTSDTTTSSGPNGAVIAVIVVVVAAIIGGYLWYRSKHKGAGHAPPG